MYPLFYAKRGYNLAISRGVPVKLSVAWLFDHIEGNWKSFDVQDLVKRIIETIAEVDHVEHVAFNVQDSALARAIKITDDMVTLSCAEWKKEYTLPFRKDAVLNSNYMIVRQNRTTVRWATLKDVGSTKEGLMPALWCDEGMIKGLWKEHIDIEDIVITIDNKSLTHRPDLWGHRGFAREIAAIYGLNMVPEEQLLAHIPVRHYERQAPITTTVPFEIVIEDPLRCKRLAVLNMPRITYRSSLISMALRLARVDARPLDALVDMTNYVMYDLGQPMHIFDASFIKTRFLARPAQEDEKLMLLDGESVELTTYDVVIADEDKALALAGIMGGRESAVSSKTIALIVEAATFDAATIRATAVRHKKRTESSIRFEKDLDPNQNTHAIARFVKLLDDAHIPYETTDAIISLGSLAQEELIEITHAEIIERLGGTLTTQQIIDSLQGLGFGVQFLDNVRYRIIVPTYRSSKQEVIKEDIIEEVGRFIGYNTLPTKLPFLPMRLVNHKKLLTTRAIKQHCAFAINMNEVYNYALYDEEFLRKVHLDLHNAVEIKNPVSHDAQRLVTSLIPHLLKNVMHNSVGNDVLKFFELARTWVIEGDRLIERSMLAGIFFSKNGINFYIKKAALESLCVMLGIRVEWRKGSHIEPWFDRYQTAALWHRDKLIGHAGLIKQQLLRNIVDGEVFAFELDAAQLVSYEALPRSYAPLSRYQEVHLDLSVLVPLRVTVAEMQSALERADHRICNVVLVDFFEKPEWADQRSLTFRLTVVDDQKTMTKQDIDNVWEQTVKVVKTLGGQLR